jgi:hypothetical protein
MAMRDRSSASVPVVEAVAVAATRRLEAEPEPDVAPDCACERDRVPLDAPATATTGDGVVNASRDLLRVKTGTRAGVVDVDGSAALDAADERRRFGGTRPNMVCVSGLCAVEKSKCCGASNSNFSSTTARKTKKEKKKLNRCASFQLARFGRKRRKHTHRKHSHRAFRT